MNKKLVLLLPAFFLTLSLGACNGKKTTTPTPEPTPSVEPTPTKPSTPTPTPTPSTPAVTPTPSTPATPTPTAKPDVPATGYAAVIGSQVITLTEDPEAQNVEAFADRKQGYKNLVSNVKAGDKIEFYKDGEAYSYVDASGDNTSAQPPVYNNYVKTSAGFAIQADSAVENNFYVNLWNANEKGEEWITFFLEGGTSADHTSGTPVSPTPAPVPTGAITYTATDLPDWITNDGCVIFAWVWSPSDTGSWKACTYSTPATQLTFVVDEELTGFLLARCAAGTTQPNWDEKSDVAGRVYNKTGDITCTAGTYSYSASSWQNA